jgi:hypothetical protein
VAVIPGVPGTTYVQTTDGTSVSKRLAKMRAEPVASRIRACLAAGNTVLVHGWRRTGPRGKRKTWALREVRITPADLSEGEVITMADEQTERTPEDETPREGEKKDEERGEEAP